MLEVIRAVAARDTRWLSSQYHRYRDRCGEGDLPVPCEGIPTGTEVDSYLGTGLACHLGSYPSPEEAMEGLLGALPLPAKIEIVIKPESAADKAGNVNVEYRLLGVTGLAGKVGAIQLLPDGRIRFMAAGGC